MQKPPIDGYAKWNFAEKGPDEVYDGQWKNGTMHGKGVYVYQGGAIYDGEFFKGKQHGKGVMMLENDASYDGEWRCGVRHGKGKITFTNGAMYDGEFDDGFMHGMGTCTYASDGRPANSELDYCWSAGDKMECQVKRSVRHGSCKYTFFNGETFSCTWVDGRCPEFSARQRVVLAHPDAASIEARVAGHESAAAFAAFKTQAADARVLALAKDSMMKAIEQTMVISPSFLPSHNFPALVPCLSVTFFLCRFHATALTPNPASKAGFSKSSPSAQCS